MVLTKTRVLYQQQGKKLPVCCTEEWNTGHLFIATCADEGWNSVHIHLLCRSGV